jgi:hypothetical protein
MEGLEPEGSSLCFLFFVVVFLSSCVIEILKTYQLQTEIFFPFCSIKDRKRIEKGITFLRVIIDVPMQLPNSLGAYQQKVNLMK